MSAAVRPPAGKRFYLPDLCRSRAALGVVLIVEVTAIVLALARNSLALDFWTDLARTSFFLLWIGLVGAGLLCALRTSLERMPVARGAMTALLLISALVALISGITYSLGHTELARTLDAESLFPPTPWSFVARNTAIACVVTALALRYFYVTNEWRKNIEMQARARVNALQARIRPHFLFNSMNTIASLTRSNPLRAEAAVQDLADLFRANLSEQRNTITLADELDVARTYQRIEHLRLGDRLKVEWQIDTLPGLALVPGLLLQPLLENAIYHGIEPQPAGGIVVVSGELSGGLITIVVRNPVADKPSDREGHQLALANIRERLGLLYGDRGIVKAGRFGDEYIVTLRFPHIENRGRLTA
jgi:two-component system sensor histidine kinase AlgZ